MSLQDVNSLLNKSLNLYSLSPVTQFKWKNAISKPSHSFQKFRDYFSFVPNFKTNSQHTILDSSAIFHTKKKDNIIQFHGDESNYDQLMVKKDIKNDKLKENSFIFSDNYKEQDNKGWGSVKENIFLNQRNNTSFLEFNLR